MDGGTGLVELERHPFSVLLTDNNFTEFYNNVKDLKTKSFRFSFMRRYES